MALWFYYSDRDKSAVPRGPLSLEQLAHLIRSHTLTENTIVYPEGARCADWAHTFPALKRRLPLSLDELCRTWVGASAKRKWPDRDWWAWEKAYRLVQVDPATGWRVICALVTAAPTDGVLGNIGALLLEDLVEQSPSLHAQIVRRAKRDRRLRRCLGFVRAFKLTPSMNRVLRRERGARVVHNTALQLTSGRRLTRPPARS